jgi:hypothetical protein
METIPAGHMGAKPASRVANLSVKSNSERISCRRHPAAVGAPRFAARVEKDYEIALRTACVRNATAWKEVLPVQTTLE